jgi:hypothetical protein
MMLKIMLKGKDFVINITSKWTHFNMHSLMMALQLNHRNKCFLTHISAILILTTVEVPKMLLQTLLTIEGLLTHITDVRTLCRMHTHVFCQATLKTKTFTTQITGIWIVIIMLEHMFFQSIQVTERNITHFTVI